jgi:hypothetical protein
MNKCSVLVAIVSILFLTGCDREKGDELDEPMKLMAVCSPTPAKVVGCTWIPLEEKYRTEAEQKLFDEGVIID